MRVGDKDIASEAVSHWKYLAPALTAPQSEGDYKHLVAVLDEILDAGGRTRRPHWLHLRNALENLSKCMRRNVFRFPMPAPLMCLLS